MQKSVKYLNLVKIKMPVGAIISIFHRLSGIILIVSLPLLITLLGMSLSGADDFLLATSTITTFNILHVLIIWALSHHVLAGIRFLLLDIDVGIMKSQANISAIVVSILSLISFLVLTAQLL